MMISAVSAGGAAYVRYNTAGQRISAGQQQNRINNTIGAASDRSYNPALLGALMGYSGIHTAKTVSFGQGALYEAFDELNQKMFTCRNLEEDRKGEEVGTKMCVSDLIEQFADKLPKEEDAVKTNIEVSADAKKGIFTEARTQIKKLSGGILYEMAVRQPRPIGSRADKTKPLTQLVDIVQEADAPEKAYVLNTKGKLMAVVEDGENVLLTNAGAFKKIDDSDGGLYVSVQTMGNVFHPFTAGVQEVKERHFEPSIGKGTEIVIGMEAGRFVPQIIDSLETFCDKINSGEIILDKFIAAPDASNVQLAMLAGGFGSRAEYTNASSDKIFHGNPSGAESTKGVFRTATGLTPMETTFITLHNAGLLDCSKGKIGIGKNIKLYLNKSGINKGNGGFTLDLYNKMERSGRKYLAIFPNDSISRMTNAVQKMHALMNTGSTAIAMIAKEVSSEDARGNFGIMKLGRNNEILEFKEKPQVIPDGYEMNGKCLTNTFQFAVSKEAFRALSILEPYFPAGGGKEPRDWSKTYIPILMKLTQEDDVYSLMKSIAEISGAKFEDIPYDAVTKAKSAVQGQKIRAVPTDEPWADCGTLNQLYHTTMQIASGDFPLEDFERKHVLDSINTETGLIASTPEQKAEIESKYHTAGQVMAVPKGKSVPESIVTDYKTRGLITINRRQNT